MVLISYHAGNQNFERLLHQFFGNASNVALHLCREADVAADHFAKEVYVCDMHHGIRI